MTRKKLSISLFTAILVLSMVGCEALLPPDGPPSHLRDLQALQSIGASAELSRVPSDSWVDWMRVEMVVSNTHETATITWTVRSGCELLVRISDATGVVSDEPAGTACDGEPRTLELAPAQADTFVAFRDLTEWPPGGYAAEAVMVIQTDHLNGDTAIAVDATGEFEIPMTYWGMDAFEMMEVRAWARQYPGYPETLEGWIELINSTEHRLGFDSQYRYCPFFFTLIDSAGERVAENFACNFAGPTPFWLSPGTTDTLYRHDTVREERDGEAGYMVAPDPGTYGFELLLNLVEGRVPLETAGEAVIGG